MNLRRDNLSSQSSDRCSMPQVFTKAPLRKGSSTWMRAPVSAVSLPSPTHTHFSITRSTWITRFYTSLLLACSHSQMEICGFFSLGFSCSVVVKCHVFNSLLSDIRMCECWSLKKCIMAVQCSWNVSRNWTDWWMPQGNCNHYVANQLFLVWPLGGNVKN